MKRIMDKQIYIIIWALLLMTIPGCSKQKFNFQITVVDAETGEPIPDARVVVRYTPGGGSGGKSFPEEGYSDIDGKVRLSGHSIFPVKVSAKAEGWYWSSVSKPLTYPENGKYVATPDQDILLELRKIKNPIPLFVSRTELIAPEKNKRIGFDFMVGDWVQPNGEGQTSDIFVTSIVEVRSTWDFDHELIIEFPNPKDGIQAAYFDNIIGSNFKSSYFAPEKGYLQEWRYSRSRRKANESAYGNFDSNRNYFLRVRTRLDSDGKIKSANYVKIYGEFPKFIYYFNPNVNDRNVEFDTFNNINPKLNILVP